MTILSAWVNPHQDTILSNCYQEGGYIRGLKDHRIPADGYEQMKVSAKKVVVVVVHESGIKVRMHPSKEAQRIDFAPNHAEIEILGTVVGKDTWAVVQLNNYPLHGCFWGFINTKHTEASDTYWPRKLQAFLDNYSRPEEPFTPQ